MKIERMLQITMAAVAVLGSLSLGIARGEFELPSLMIFAAVTSVLFTDTLRWLRLHRGVSNLALIGAAIFSLADFFNTASEQKLMAVASLLVYAQVILLYQEKNPRIYGHVAVLSLLEVVVGALLNDGFEFGILLVAYTMTSFLALALLYVYRETLRFAADETAASGAGAEPGPGTAAEFRSDPDSRAWGNQLLGERPVAHFTLGSAVLSSELRQHGFTRQLLSMALITLVLAVAFFCSAPRSAGSAWRSGRFGQRAVVGFAPEINLGDLGRILQSDAVAMRISFHDSENTPYRVIGDPYIRGAVLTRYNNETSRIFWHGTRRPVSTRRGRSLPPPPADSEIVWQEIVLEPSNERLLFGIFPWYQAEGAESTVRFDPWLRQIYRSRREGAMSVERFHYTLATTGFSNGFQAQLAPLLEESLADRAALNAESRDALSFQRQAFPKLGQLADQIILDADFPVEEKNAILVAHELESYLRDSTRFTYSLDLNEVRRQRNPESDPVEDFVTNHRTGHCEYFASALALMLRSQGIPSRVVVGYRASEFNAYGQYFRVRQRDAHAWVEALLTPEQVPDDMPEKALPNFRGAWLRLDPTPSASSRRSAAVQRGLVDEIYDTLDYAQMLWGSYVMGMNPEQQRTSIYEPLADSTAEAILNPLGMRDAAFGWLASLLGLKAEDRENWQWRTWFSWRAALAAVVLCLTLLALLRVLQKLSRSLLVRLRRRRRKLRSRKVVRVEFYEKLERLLARLGLHRRSTQTQREFAIEATGLLADSVGLRTGARLPRQIAQAFYVVRFGGRQLDSSELADVEQALQSLESLIAHRSASSTAK